MHYSRPGLLVGDDFDYKVDLSSIGVMLYRLYFNEYPYNRDTRVTISNGIKKDNNLNKRDNPYFDYIIKKSLIIFDVKNLKTIISYYQCRNVGFLFLIFE